jgi:hypothetical protein
MDNSFEQASICRESGMRFARDSGDIVVIGRRHGGEDTRTLRHSRSASDLPERLIRDHVIGPPRLTAARREFRKDG